MFTGRVIQHHVNQYPNATAVRFGHETLEVVVGAVVALDGVVVGNVVAVITRRLSDRHQPETRRTQVRLRVGIAVVDVIEFRGQAVEVPDPVAVAVSEGANEDLITHGTACPILVSESHHGCFSVARTRRDREGHD